MRDAVPIVMDTLVQLPPGLCVTSPTDRGIQFLLTFPASLQSEDLQLCTTRGLVCTTRGLLISLYRRTQAARAWPIGRL
jgi:hypothetical protein